MKVLCWGLLGIVGLTSCSGLLPLVATVDSPAKTYQARLKGNPKAPSFFLSPDNEMRLDVYKDGKPYISHVKLDSYDSMDADWEILHPDHIWVNDSLLRFGWKKDFSDSDPDLVSVKNETSKTIKYLKIDARDIFLLLEIAPQSCVQLKAAHQGWISGVTANGLFEDGRSIGYGSSNFFHQDKAEKPLQYCITIHNEGLKVNSPNLPGDNGSIEPACSCDKQLQETQTASGNL